MPFPSLRRATTRSADARGPVATAHADILALIAQADERTLARQVALARVPAPTGAEARRAAAVRDALRAVGYGDAGLDRHGNVVASLVPPDPSCDARPVACLAHLDTVFPEQTPLDPRRVGGRWHCPGIGDNGRGLAAMVTLAEVFRRPEVRATLRRPIAFVATVGEEAEGNLAGARGWFTDAAAAGGPPCAAVALDGPGDSRIVHHAVASARWRVTFRGEGGHSWADFGAPNPAVALAAFIQRASTLSQHHDRRLAVTVSRLGGGESLTAIPRQAWCDLDVRSTNPSLLVTVERELRRLAVGAAADGVAGPTGRRAEATLAATVAPLESRPGGAIAADHPLVALAAIATEHLGVAPVSASGSTDANIPLSLGIPAITLGAGGTGGGAHTRDEWYENVHGARGVQRAFLVLAALAGAPAPLAAD